MNRLSLHAVVIGGGVIGAMTAYHLTQAGWRVTIVERNGFGQGSSWGNCGIILPSHVLTLNTVDNLALGLRWMLKKDAPFAIRPRFDPALFSWLGRFAAGCTEKSRRRSALAVAALIGTAVEAYDALIQTENIGCDWQRKGAIHLFRNAAAFARHAAVEMETQRFGPGCVPLDARTVREIEPAAAPGVVGAWMDENAAHLRPDALMAELRRVLARQGVSILENTAWHSFRTERGRAKAANTSRGEVRADAFVVAGGAWAPLHCAAIGRRIPIQPGKGYSVTLSGTEGAPEHPCFFEETRSVATPWKSGFRLGGMMEFAGYDDRIDPIRIAALFSAAGRYLRLRKLGRVEEQWCGWRPMTLDGVPIIDRLPGAKNVVLAAGHNMLGISMAPATGRLAAELLTGQPPHVDPAPYRLDRFG
ncbi:MAG: FAD-binding oxidoreductase [Desulfobacterales bacterium]|nr:FAD-binding oxidoreductase [Desulfobacterales bacterium]